MLVRFYSYLYYRIYSWNLRTWGQSDLPQYNALFGVSFLLFMNIISIPIVIEAVSGYRVLEISKINKLLFIGFALMLLLLSYFLLVHNEKYLKIARDFSHESVAERKGRFIAILSYVIVTFVTFFGFGWIILLKNS